MEYGLIVIAGLGILACVVIAWRLTAALTSLSRSCISEKDRERIDSDRMMQIFVEKYQAGNPEVMAKIHGEEEYQKWKLTKKFDEQSEAELNSRREIAKMKREERVPVGGENVEPYT